jgi:hypothetical protein
LSCRPIVYSAVTLYEIPSTELAIDLAICGWHDNDGVGKFILEETGACGRYSALYILGCLPDVVGGPTGDSAGQCTVDS